MSMLDSFFSKGFKAAKCKTLLKLTIPRIKLLRNRREIQIKQMRRDIAKLLETGQEATARIRVEHIIREENMMAAQEIIELYCELIAVRLPIIETQRECPLDLKEAISSVCFAAPRCADLPELLQVQILFAAKYGKEFVAAATELMPACGVNRQLIELLSVRPPSPEKKLNLLKEIAEEHELDWDPAASETELLKKHEDLLNGPTQFVTMLPLPKEKHDELLNSTPENANNEQRDSDTDTLDFPEVPTAPLRPSVTAVSAPEITPPVQAAIHPDPDHESSNHSLITKDLSKEPRVEHEDVNEENSVATKDEMPNASVAASEIKQFVPFISPPSLSSSSFSATPSTLPTSVSRTKSEGKVDLHDVPAAAYGVVETAECAETLSTSPASVSKTKSEASVDLRDVLAAAQAAADTAERAAAAARSAATLAQARIGELTKKSSEKFPESGNDNPFYAETSDEKQHFVHQQSFGDLYGVSNYSGSHQLNEGHQASKLPDIPSFEKLKVGYDSPRGDHTPEQGSARHHPQRLPSMDDEQYFSYPNLFTSQNSNLGSTTLNVTDHSRSNHDI